MSEHDQPSAAPELMSEDNLARRIKYEMDQRGWSQERMAKEMTEAGFPIHQTSVGKIVNPGAGKRRAINVDDALGFAKVFGVPLEQMLVPLETILDEELFSTLLRLIDLNRQRMTIDLESMELATRFVEISRHLGSDDPEAILQSGRWTGTGPVVEEVRRWGKRLIGSLENPEMRGKSVQEVIKLLREEEARKWQRERHA